VNQKILQHKSIQNSMSSGLEDNPALYGERLFDTKIMDTKIQDIFENWETILMLILESCEISNWFNMHLRWNRDCDTFGFQKLNTKVDRSLMILANLPFAYSVSDQTLQNYSLVVSQTPIAEFIWDYVMGDDESRDGLKQTYAWYSKMPKTGVNFIDCIHFCNQLSMLSNLPPCYIWDSDKSVLSIDEKSNGYRLLTDMEWVYVAKADTTNTWSGANTESELKDFAWFNKNASWTVHEIGQKKPNEWGMYDMSGNVYEWTTSYLLKDETETEKEKENESGEFYRKYEPAILKKHDKLDVRDAQDVEYLDRIETKPTSNISKKDDDLKMEWGEHSMHQVSISDEMHIIVKGGSYMNSSEICKISTKAYMPNRKKDAKIGFRVCRSLIQY
jgi:hypothetical protein